MTRRAYHHAIQPGMIPGNWLYKIYTPDGDELLAGAWQGMKKTLEAHLAKTLKRLNENAGLAKRTDAFRLPRSDDTGQKQAPVGKR